MPGFMRSLSGSSLNKPGLSLEVVLGHNNLSHKLGGLNEVQCGPLPCDAHVNEIVVGAGHEIRESSVSQSQDDSSKFRSVALKSKDDSILFYEAEEMEVCNIKRVLRCFELISGLKINYHKSQIPFEKSESASHSIAVMKKSITTHVMFFICMFMLASHGFARDIPIAKQTDDSAKETEAFLQFWSPWAWMHPPFFFPHPHPFPLPGLGHPWALPPLPAHKFPPFTWPKPGHPWALPPLPAHKFPPSTWPKPGFPPFTWPKPGHPWALPPLPAHKFPPFTWPKPGRPWALPPLPAHKFPPFTWPNPWRWAFPPLPSPKFPQNQESQTSSSAKGETALPTKA
ncbi:hypothetical protein HYC85_028303 [Camellia sinensis]|uniref:Uncharacterized protein n=1 Tax=Camellia sinensis TaxID=4442 RepID=A0A7J7FUY3_CAMSI|nr:hypothetical protein HYC85_028303 [Camellia sinensis]